MKYGLCFYRIPLLFSTLKALLFYSMQGALSFFDSLTPNILQRHKEISWYNFIGISASSHFWRKCLVLSCWKKRKVDEIDRVEAIDRVFTNSNYLLIRSSKAFLSNVAWKTGWWQFQFVDTLGVSAQIYCLTKRRDWFSRHDDFAIRAVLKISTLPLAAIRLLRIPDMVMGKWESGGGVGCGTSEVHSVCFIAWRVPSLSHLNSANFSSPPVVLASKKISRSKKSLRWG